MVSRYKVLYESINGVSSSIPTELDFVAANLFYDDTVALPTTGKSTVQDILDYLKSIGPYGLYASANTVATTTSPAYVQLNSLTLTPTVTGNYFVVGSCQVNAASGSPVYIAVFANGAQVANTERLQDGPAGLHDFSLSTNCSVSVTAGQPIAIYWKTVGAAASCTNRSLNIVKTAG